MNEVGMAADPVPRCRLPRSSRLPSRRRYLEIKRQGQRRLCGCLILNWVLLPPGSPPRLGVVTHRRLGGAVARSRARRLLREAFRRHQWDLTQPVDIVLVARTPAACRSFTTVERDYLAGLRRAGLLR
ncbi:MAG TPA: ribonuclease P protein component [Candidatus Paceibacterota bacterium]|nr:ribonuclease P protein component [Candidatus Paceibacterota bacterium]